MDIEFISSKLCILYASFWEKFMLKFYSSSILTISRVAAHFVVSEIYCLLKLIV